MQFDHQTYSLSFLASQPCFGPAMISLIFWPVWLIYVADSHVPLFLVLEDNDNGMASTWSKVTTHKGSKNTAQRTDMEIRLVTLFILHDILRNLEMKAIS
jgi:hypothetical protein